MSGEEGRANDPGRSKNRGSAGVRPWGRHVLIAFLVLSLVVAGFGALQAYWAQSRHQETATALLQDYSEFAAWSYERSSWELLRQSIDNHLDIAYSNRQFALGHAAETCLQEILDPGKLDPSCNCGHHLAGDYAFFTRLGEPVSQSVWSGTIPESMHQTAVVEAAQRHAREQYGEDWQFAVLHIEQLEEAPIVAYTLLEAPITEVPAIISADLTPQRDTVLYGFQIDRDLLAFLYARALNDEVLLPPTLTRDRANGDVINVQVLGPDGSLLYASSPETEMTFAAPVERQEIFGGGEIRASVLPKVASELIIGGLPGDRTGVLALIFLLATALAVLAIVQIRGEDQLALLRQDFVASVSHELRTPLAQVKLFTETLRLGRTRSEDQRDWALGNIDRETRRLTNLVENILHFSRSERGVQHIDRAPADLAVDVREAIASFEPLMPERKGRLIAEVPEGLIASIHGDSIRQVVLNLLDNALRYGREGQTIRVGGSKTDDHVRISVDDEGPGVPIAERERIFEPFQRGAHAVGTVVVGSGIGLAVVREIITAHEGRIWVEDAPTGGARFVFELPALHTALPGHFSDPSVDREAASGVA